MNGIREVLETEARRRAKIDRLYKGFAKFMVWMTVVCTVVALLRKPSLGDLFETIAPLLALVGLSAGYSPNHRRALGAAIADPDPALDLYFAQTLASFDPAIFSIGREAFDQRFTTRLPEIGPAEWRTVALSLLRTHGRHAENLLSLLRRGGTVSTLDSVEAFAASTKSDRLRTAAQDTLAEIRLRSARERVLEAVELSERGQTAEKERLCL